MTAPVKTWASLPASAETDAALRVAAAEKVMGWRKRRKVRLYQRRAWRDRRDNWMAPASWNPAIRRDDLARVFVAARPRLGDVGFVTIEPGNVLCAAEPQRLWLIAQDDPRAALCGLLDLLEIPVPADLNP